MSRKKNNQTGAIQKRGGNVPAVIDTPEGPATIQIIDIPSSALAPIGPGAPAIPTKGPGINILGAVLRRWWLVLLVAVFVGGTGAIMANKLIKPSYEAEAVVLYQMLTPIRANGMTMATDPAEVVRTHMELLTKPDIARIAARNPELQQALPFLRGVDLDRPDVEKEVVRQLRGICEAFSWKKDAPELILITSTQAEPHVAAAVVNAFADAFVQHCAELVLGRDGVKIKRLKEEFEQQDALLKEMIRKKNELMANNAFKLQEAQTATITQEIANLWKLKNDAEIKRMAFETELAKFEKAQGREDQISAKLAYQRQQMIEAEKQKDSLLAAANIEHIRAYTEYQNQLAQGKTEQHRDTILAKGAVDRAKKAYDEREAEIAAAIDAKVTREQKLLMGKDIEEKRASLLETEIASANFQKRLDEIGDEAKKLAVEQQKLDALNEQISRIQPTVAELYNQLHGIKGDQRLNSPDAIITVAERAEIPTLPKDDKRLKVQAASMIGGLFLGIFLALLIDRFDKRLRNPRDIEPLLGAPMLGMIPRIQELKKVKGESARSLIAEEFRIIRTQLLFGNPDTQHKVICVTSPVPGDGKTSLAVNLAISLAKAGRKVVLIDCDLRKPDIHRIFNVPVGPGIAELIQGQADIAGVARKTDVDLLDVIPAGNDTGRPCELLSRPEVGPLLTTLGDTYDHIVLDTAPVLPVSDTHVLLPVVDGVICSFNAEVDSDTVKMTEEILRRNRANIIGSVMNQVKYKQSSSYQRGKSAYSSYYSYGPRPETPADAPALAASAPAAAIGMDEAREV